MNLLKLGVSVARRIIRAIRSGKRRLDLSYVGLWVVLGRNWFHRRQTPLRWTEISRLFVECLRGANVYVYWLSQQYMNVRGTKRALQFARRNVTASGLPGISLLRANAAGNDREWLCHVNQYLADFGTPPVALTTGGGGRFSRLCAGGSSTAVDDGPLISVIMPAFDSVNTIEQSVGSILSQTWRNLELIIVDDCSADGTWEKVQELAASDKRVRLLRNVVNVGPYVSKNLALRVVRGTFVTGQDADDWAHPCRLELDMKVLKDQQAKAVVSRLVRLNSDGQFFPYTGLKACKIHQPSLISMIIEVSLLRSCLGSWDSVRFAADSEMSERIARVVGRPPETSTAIGLFCLQHSESLTSHPVYGNISAPRGVSPVRQVYKDEYRRWHGSIDRTGSFVGFPLKERKYSAPDVMVVPLEAVYSNVAAHDGQVA